MKWFSIALLALLVGCSQPEQAPANARACGPLPEPLGNTIAAQRAYTLTVIAAYVECAKKKG